MVSWKQSRPDQQCCTRENVTKGITKARRASIWIWLMYSCYGAYLGSCRVDFLDFLQANCYCRVGLTCKFSSPNANIWAFRRFFHYLGKGFEFFKRWLSHDFLSWSLYWFLYPWILSLSADGINKHFDEKPFLLMKSDKHIVACQGHPA